MRELPTLHLNAAVPEAWIAHVLRAGISPTEFASWVLQRIDLNGLLAEYQSVASASPDPSQADTSGEPPVLQGVASRTPATLGAYAKRQGSDGEWTRELFLEFLDLVSQMEAMIPSMRLLGAYIRLGPVPTSDALQRLCGFESDTAWQQALRVAKQKLTLEARRLNAPPLFPRAKTGTAGERLHPIERKLFPWLKEWGEQQEGGAGNPEEAFPAPETWGSTEKETERST